MSYIQQPPPQQQAWTSSQGGNPSAQMQFHYETPLQQPQQPQQQQQQQQQSIGVSSQVQSQFNAQQSQQQSLTQEEEKKGSAQITRARPNTNTNASTGYAPAAVNTQNQSANIIMSRPAPQVSQQTQQQGSKSPYTGTLQAPEIVTAESNKKENDPRAMTANSYLTGNGAMSQGMFTNGTGQINGMNTNQMNGSQNMGGSGMNTGMNSMNCMNQMNQMGTNQMNGSQSMMCSGTSTGMNSICGTNQMNQMNGSQNMGGSGTSTGINGMNCTNQMNQMGTNQMNGSQSMMCSGTSTGMNSICGTNQINQMGTNQMNGSQNMGGSGTSTGMNSMNCTNQMNQMNGSQSMMCSGTSTGMNSICGTNQMNQMGTNQMNGSKSMMCGGMNTSMNAMCGTNQMNQMGTNQMNDSKSMMCSGMNTSMNSMNCTNQMNGGQNMGYSGTNTSMNGICGTNQINMNRMCMNMPMNGMGGMNQMNMNGMCMNGMGANGMYMNMPMIAMGQMSPAVQYNQTGATTNRVASGGNQGNAQPEPTKVEGNSLGWYAKSIKVTDWYKYVTGYNETNFAYVFEDKLKVDEGKLYNQNIPTEDKKVENSQKHYITGKFQLESIGDLIKSFECTPNAMSPITNCPLRIYVPGPCTNMQLYFYELGVATLQADPANANCMFQAASNFSCIEAITESSFPDMIDFTTNYYKDLTQGPAASISAGPAAIARVLEPFSKQGSQTSLHQINVLDNLKEYYNIENGYVVNDKTKGAKTFTVAEMNDILNKIKIGYVNGADVVFGGRHKTDMNVLKKPHQINQVFTAAMNLRQGDNGKRNATLQDKEIKARTLLRGAYLGTYLCALKSRSPRLFLTLIGGGSFGNDISWILGEVINAHKMVALSQKNGTLKSVELVMFNVPQCMDGFIRRLNEEKIPYNYIQITLR